MSLSGGPYRQRVSFSVEDVLVQADEVGVIGEKQIKVFESFSQEEALHLVTRTGVVWVPHIINGRVATRGNLKQTLTWVCNNRALQRMMTFHLTVVQNATISAARIAK